MQGIDKKSSERLNLLRFPLIVGVIFIHAKETQVAFSGQTVGLAESSLYVNFIISIISNGLARIAVPLFFIIAGYFFFLNFKLSIHSYKSKLYSRRDSLLIPYIFWNSALLLMLAIVQAIPATQSLIAGKGIPIAQYGLYDYVNALIGIDSFPIAYQFWFIRDLILMVLLSPFITFLLDSAKVITLVTLFVCWFFDLWILHMPAVSTCFFFYLGAYVAKNKESLFLLDRYGQKIVMLYLVILISDVAIDFGVFDTQVHQTGIILGIVSGLYLTKLLYEHNSTRRLLSLLAPLSFFIFAFHEPLLNLCRKVTFKVIPPQSDIETLLLYFINPLLVIVISIITYHLLRVVTPRFLIIITGSRS